MKQTPFCIKREPSQLSKAERGNWREGRGGGGQTSIRNYKDIEKKREF